MVSLAEDQLAELLTLEATPWPLLRVEPFAIKGLARV